VSTFFAQNGVTRLHHRHDVKVIATCQDALFVIRVRATSPGMDAASASRYTSVASRTPSRIGTMMFQ